MLSGLMRVMLKSSSLHYRGHCLSLLKRSYQPDWFRKAIGTLYIHSFSVGISCTQPGWPLVRGEARREIRKAKIPDLQPKQQILNVVVLVK